VQPTSVVHRTSLTPVMAPLTAEGPRILMPTGFLQLPYELRRQIYCYCIPRQRRINVSLPSLPLVYLEDLEGSLEDDDWPNILRLSKQISEECLNILYGENIFHVDVNGGGEYSLRNNFTEENRRRMRYLIIIAQPAGVSMRQACQMIHCGPQSSRA
jgi:hypothetical protein